MLKNRNNNQVIDNNQIVSFRMIRSEDGTFKITKRETMNRTKHMIAFDKRLDWDEVSVGKNLEEDLGYIEKDKKNLKDLIENVFFRDVNVIIDSKDLVKAATVRDLYEIIWDKYNQQKEILENNNLVKALTYVDPCDSVPPPENRITSEQVECITRKMIAERYGWTWDSPKTKKAVKLTTKLVDLGYDKPQHKWDLADIIRINYFKTYNAHADIKDLEKANTIGDLSKIIYNKCIPKDNKK